MGEGDLENVASREFWEDDREDRYHHDHHVKPASSGKGVLRFRFDVVLHARFDLKFDVVLLLVGGWGG